MTRLQLPTFNSTSQTVALASLLSFGAQVLFALLMLRWFTPQEVGEFSVISQIAFFWMTLALAQAPLSFLANSTDKPQQDARRYWRSSVRRWFFMAPLAVLMVWVSQDHAIGAIGWVMLIALCQLTWSLAQSFVLSTGNTAQQLLVRVVPPLCSLMVAWIGSLVSAEAVWQGPTLLLAACIGYFVGSLWLLPAWLQTKDKSTDPADASSPNLFVQKNKPSTRDNRSVTLKLTHVFFDVLLATLFLIVWQRLYGVQETGWLSALLRVLGFVPAVIHMAWAQVKLSRPKQADDHSLLMGWLGSLVLIAIGLGSLIALQTQWLDSQWDGITHYLWPLIVWQGSACLAACVSHRPFQTGVASLYSRACIGIASLQMASLVLPWALHISLTPQQHLLFFTTLSSLCLLLLAKWMQAVPDQSQ